MPTITGAVKQRRMMRAVATETMRAIPGGSKTARDHEIALVGRFWGVGAGFSLELLTALRS
jgi:hypothetical protein